MNIYIDFPRNELLEKINHRVKGMIKKGAIQEVKRFIKLKVPKNKSANKAIGINELKDFINKPCEEMCKITTLTIYNCRDIQVLSTVIHNLINLTITNKKQNEKIKI